jgi:Fic family protein
MDATKYSDGRTGELVSIRIPAGPEIAFIPNSLPPTWTFPTRLIPKLIEARAALAKLDGIGRTIPDPELLLRPLKTREAITSSRIEGTYATAEELMLFELSDAEPKSARDPVNAWREVSNYARALSRGAALLDELPFCGRLMKELHHILISGVRGQHAVPGEYRDHQVAIGSDRRYVPPPVPQMLNAMDALERYINTPDDAYDPLVRACLVHYQFEAIHPFADGNGRIGRVLLSLMISKWCNLSMPWLYLSPFFEKFKDEYVGNMFQISTEGAWETWVDFCLAGTIQQANDAIVRCEKLGALRSEMLQRGREFRSTRTEQIIEGLFRAPIVRVTSLAKSLGISYPTAQSDVERLIKAKILQPLAGVRPKAYFSPEIWSIAYNAD